jgi:hypothetical protein
MPCSFWTGKIGQAADPASCTVLPLLQQLFLFFAFSGYQEFCIIVMIVNRKLQWK